MIHFGPKSNTRSVILLTYHVYFRDTVEAGKDDLDSNLQRVACRINREKMSKTGNDLIDVSHLRKLQFVQTLKRHLDIILFSLITLRRAAYFDSCPLM